MNPTNDSLWTNKGFALEGLGKYEEAIDWLDLKFRVIIILVTIKQLNWTQRIIWFGITKGLH